MTRRNRPQRKRSALATSDRTGYRAFEAELHRARGEILPMRDSANPAPAEDYSAPAKINPSNQGIHYM